VKYIKLLIIFIIASFCLVIPNRILAQSNLTKYATLKLGQYTPTGDLDDFDSEFIGELTFGGYLTPYKSGSFEIGVGRFSLEDSVNGYHPELGFWDETVEVTVTQFLLSLKGHLQHKNAEFIIGAGFGLYLVELEDKYRSDLTGDLSASGDDTTFGLHLSAGGNYSISKIVFIGIEGRMIFTNDFRISDEVLGIPIEWKGNGDGYTISGLIGVRF